MNIVEVKPEWIINF